MTAGEHLLGDLAMPGGPGKLVDDVAVPLEAEPVEAIDQSADRLRRRAVAVRILDPQQHPPSVVAGVEPVEQSRARAADMKETGRGGCEARDDFVGHVGSIQGFEEAAIRCFKGAVCRVA